MTMQGYYRLLKLNITNKSYMACYMDAYQINIDKCNWNIDLSLNDFIMQE